MFRFKSVVLTFTAALLSVSGNFSHANDSDLQFDVGPGKRAYTFRRFIPKFDEAKLPENSVIKTRATLEFQNRNSAFIEFLQTFNALESSFIKKPITNTAIEEHAGDTSVCLQLFKYKDAFDFIDHMPEVFRFKGKSTTNKSPLPSKGLFYGAKSAIISTGQKRILFNLSQSAHNLVDAKAQSLATEPMMELFNVCKTIGLNQNYAFNLPLQEKLQKAVMKLSPLKIQKALDLENSVGVAKSNATENNKNSDISLLDQAKKEQIAAIRKMQKQYAIKVPPKEKVSTSSSEELRDFPDGSNLYNTDKDITGVM